MCVYFKYYYLLKLIVEGGERVVDHFGSVNVQVGIISVEGGHRNWLRICYIIQPHFELDTRTEGDDGVGVF